METKDYYYLSLYFIQAIAMIGLFMYQKNKLDFLEKYNSIISIDKIKQYADMREETATMKATKIVMDESNPLINQVTETVHEIYEGKTKEMFDRYKELFDAVMIHYEKSNDKNKDSVFKSAFPKNYDLMIKTVSDYHKSNERHS